MFKKIKVYLIVVALLLQSLMFSTVSFAADQVISNTIVVKAGTTYDGGGKRIIAQGMGDGSQSESQKPIFILEKGATLKNVRIGAPGCDGVHCYGDNLVENVVWEDVGEDALTVKASGTVTIRGGSASYAADKVFQLNAACTFKVDGFTAYDFGKAVRQNGGTTFRCDIYIENSKFTKAKDSIARTDSSITHVYYRNLTVSEVSTWWAGFNPVNIHKLEGFLGYYKMENRGYANMYIDGMGRTVNGSDCGQWSGGTSYNQQWELINVTGAYYKLKNRATGLYLDGMGRTSSGSIVGQWSDSPNYNQQWEITNMGNGYYKIKNRSTGMVLDNASQASNGSPLRQWGDNGNYNQQWKLYKQ